jgi:hypothetical protein
MTRGEFTRELGGIVQLLKEHAFLQFSPTGMREYLEKERLASELFARLISAMAGIELSVPRSVPPPLGPQSATGYSSAIIAAKRMANNLRLAARSLPPAERSRYETMAGDWVRAIEAIETKRD